MQREKALFTDLDGTLLSDDLSVSQKNQRAIEWALAHGNCVVAATGRPLESGKAVMENLGLTKPGCFMIAFNGSVLYDCFEGKILYERTIPLVIVRRLFDGAKEAGIYIQTYDRKDILTEEYTRELEYYAGRTKMSYRLLKNGASELETEPYKVLLIDLSARETLEAFRISCEPWTKKELNAFFSCPQYLEYCPVGVSKGEAVLNFCRMQKIPVSHTIAVGDEQNDISMLQTAQIGVAVKNAAKEVKDAAGYVTEHDNNHDAIAEVIEKFM